MSKEAKITVIATTVLSFLTLAVMAGAGFEITRWVVLLASLAACAAIGGYVWIRLDRPNVKPATTKDWQRLADEFKDMNVGALGLEADYRRWEGSLIPYDWFVRPEGSLKQTFEVYARVGGKLLKCTESFVKHNADYVLQSDLETWMNELRRFAGSKEGPSLMTTTTVRTATMYTGTVMNIASQSRLLAIEMATRAR